MFHVWKDEREIGPKWAKHEYGKYGFNSFPAAIDYIFQQLGYALQCTENQLFDGNIIEFEIRDDDKLLLKTISITIKIDMYKDR